MEGILVCFDELEKALETIIWGDTRRLYAELRQSCIKSERDNSALLPQWPDDAIFLCYFSSSAMLSEGIWKDFERKTVRLKVWGLSPGW